MVYFNMFLNLQVFKFLEKFSSFGGVMRLKIVKAIFIHLTYKENWYEHIF